MFKRLWKAIVNVAIKWVFGVRTVNATVGDHNHVVYVGDIEHANFVLMDYALASAVHRFVNCYPTEGQTLLGMISERASLVKGKGGAPLELEALKPFLKQNGLHIRRKELSNEENPTFDRGVCPDVFDDGVRKPPAGGE